MIAEFGAQTRRERLRLAGTASDTGEAAQVTEIEAAQEAEAIVGDLLLRILPQSVGASISPTMLTATILILSGRERQRARAAVYAAGAVVVLAVLGALGLALASQAMRAAPHPRGAAATIDIALGALLFVVALRLALRKESEDKKGEDSARAEPEGLRRFALLGVVMMGTNFSTFVFYFSAIKEIAFARVSAFDEVLALSEVGLFAMLPVLVPLAIYTAMPRAAGRILQPVGAFVKRHRRSMGIAVCLLIGVYLIGKGALALSKLD